MKKKMIALMLTLAMILTMIAGVQITASAESEGIWNYSIYDGEATITGCTEPVGDLTIPDTLGGCPVTRIGEFALQNSANLTSVFIPDGITNIQYNAFYGCTSLNNISIPDSITDIESCAFENSGYYNNQDNWKNGVLYIGNHLIKAAKNISGEYIVNNGTKSIAGWAFANCQDITSVILPESLLSISDYAFSGCEKLNSVTFPKNLAYIGGQAFVGCTNLTSIDLPDGVILGWSSESFWQFESTGYFNDESNWENNVLYLDNYLIRATQSISDEYIIKLGTKVIAPYAFYECSDLTSVIIPNSVMRIDGMAFCGCEKLTSITIPNGMTYIGAWAFSCSNLTTITIPSSVTSIDDYAFDGCDNLTIYGYAGSDAESYANENDIPFVVLEKQEIIGDLDGSTAVDVGDIMKIKDLIMKENATSALLAVGDLNGNGRLDVGDIMEIKNLIMTA